MGYQTNISILNDHWHRIQKEPGAFIAAINHLMNGGSNSLVEEHFAHERGQRSAPSDWWADTHYVTVHKAQHADIKQITVTYHNSSWDVYDFTRGVELGVLDSKSNTDTWVGIGRELVTALRDQADNLARALDERYPAADDAQTPPS